MARRKMRIRLKVRDIAEERGITRAWLARRADLTYETVFKLWDDPYRDVSLSTLVKIAQAMRCKVTDLYTIEPDEPTDQ